MIAKVRREHPGASIVRLGELTGMTPKQVWHTLEILRKRSVQVLREQYGACPGGPDCGPCDDCITMCGNPRCKKPITRNQSYTKVYIDGHEAKVHLACAGIQND